MYGGRATLKRHRSDGGAKDDGLLLPHRSLGWISILAGWLWILQVFSILWAFGCARFGRCWLEILVGARFQQCMFQSREAQTGWMKETEEWMEERKDIG